MLFLALFQSSSVFGCFLSHTFSCPIWNCGTFSRFLALFDISSIFDCFCPGYVIVALLMIFWLFSSFLALFLIIFWLFKKCHIKNTVLVIVALLMIFLAIFTFNTLVLIRSGFILSRGCGDILKHILW